MTNDNDNLPFRLGTVTYNAAKDWDLETLLRILPAAGVEAIEFRTTHLHGVEPSLNASQREEVKRRCRDAGLRIWALGSICEFHSPEPALVRRNVDTCAQFVQLAHDLGAQGVKVRPNGFPDGVEHAKTLEQIGKALHECGEFGQDHGVEIFLEVHGRGTQEPANIRALLDHCAHPNVGACWNSNPTDVKNGSVRESFELLGATLKSCHINELRSGYPYGELFSLMRVAGYNRYTLCEVSAPVPPEDGLAFYRKYRADWLELAGG